MVWLERRGEEIVVELPEEWGGVVPSDVFLDKAREIAESAKKEASSFASSVESPSGSTAWSSWSSGKGWAGIRLKEERI